MRSTRSLKQTESDVKKAILQYLSHVPKISIFPVATTGMWDPTQKRFRKSTGRIGTPDILCCLNGKFVAFEVKTKSGKVSPEQENVIKDIQFCNGYAFVVRSVEEVMGHVREITQHP